jgi:predicted TIM-barrel fold metal-dependent hydrolase
MSKAGLLFWMLFASQAAAAQRLPIIDMHLHARTAKYAGEDPPPMCTPFAVMPRSDPARGPAAGMAMNVDPPCASPIPAATTDEQVMRDTIAVMERRNIIGMVSGEPGLMRTWRAAAPQRIIPGIDLRLPGTKGHSHVAARSVAQLRALHSRGELKVLGEIMAQYEGVAPNDARLEPYWALAEELDIPAAIHMGPGEPAQPYGSGGYRAALGNPLLLEEVLVRHPRLRLYIMHAGYPLAAELRALMFSHPQVYVDVGSIVYTEPRPAFYRFLQEIVDAGYGDRIMFGSDQMIWPGIIEPSIAAIEQAPFLTPAQKRDILYNNAARFLRLSKQDIARHHRM